MKILYLYAELMGYQIPVLQQYVLGYNADVHVVHWDKKKLTPYIAPTIKGVSYYNRSEFDFKKLLDFAKDLNPDIVYISGWMDKDYMKVCRKLRKQGTPVVAGSDSQWRKTCKQQIGRFYFQLFMKQCYSHIWVPGPYQYEYARKLGFKKKEIIYNLFSADTKMFSKNFEENQEQKRNNYPHNFLYVGRFEKVKGIDVLLEAWRKVKKKDWTLTIIGNGSMKPEIEQHSDIILKDFMQPEDLLLEIKNAGCFILPSIREQWGVVIHEFAAAGVPLIVADNCGGAPVFVTPKYNGFLFETGNSQDLCNKMEKITNMSDNELLEFSKNSYQKGQIVTPKVVAASFLSVCKDE